MQHQTNVQPILWMDAFHYCCVICTTKKSNAKLARIKVFALGLPQVAEIKCVRTWISAIVEVGVPRIPKNVSHQLHVTIIRMNWLVYLLRVQMVLVLSIMDNATKWSAMMYNSDTHMRLAQLWIIASRMDNNVSHSIFVQIIWLN